VLFHTRMGSKVAFAASRMIAVAVAFARRNTFLGFAGVSRPWRAADNLVALVSTRWSKCLLIVRYEPLSTYQDVDNIHNCRDTNRASDHAPVYLGEVLHGRYSIAHGHGAHIHSAMVSMRHVDNVLRARANAASISKCLLKFCGGRTAHDNCRERIRCGCTRPVRICQKSCPR
jgi:hypothetical protein